MKKKSKKKVNKGRAKVAKETKVEKEAEKEIKVEDKPENVINKTGNVKFTEA